MRKHTFLNQWECFKLKKMIFWSYCLYKTIKSPKLIIHSFYHDLWVTTSYYEFDHRLGQALSAYRKTHSCETTLINLIENWRHARDNKHLLEILSTDMSKAFDSMHPALLLSKLRAYGFEENFINLLRSYLCGRSNRVKLASRKNSWKRVNRGCPQGSALGLLLWNIFQNDLVYEIERNLSM